MVGAVDLYGYPEGLQHHPPLTIGKRCQIGTNSLALGGKVGQAIALDAIRVMPGRQPGPVDL